MIVLQTIGELACAAKVKFIPQNEEIFTDCPNEPKNVLNIEGMFDMTYVEMKMNEEYNVIGRGNATTIWNIEKNDQVKVREYMNSNDKNISYSIVNNKNMWHFRCNSICLNLNADLGVPQCIKCPFRIYARCYTIKISCGTSFGPGMYSIAMRSRITVLMYPV